MSAEGGWKVHGTKKGALPISVEKRPCGKKVTLINNVTNPGALLHELKGRYVHAHVCALAAQEPAPRQRPSVRLAPPRCVCPPPRPSARRCDVGML